MPNIVMRVLLLALAVGGFAFLVDGGNQTGIMDGLFVDLGALGDESNGLAFMILGGTLVVMGTLGSILWRLENRVVRLQREVERLNGQSSDDG